MHCSHEFSDSEPLAQLLHFPEKLFKASRNKKGGMDYTIRRELR